MVIDIKEKSNTTTLIVGNYIYDECIIILSLNNFSFQTVSCEGVQTFVSPLLSADLHDSVEEDPIPFDKLQKYVKDALKGLAYLHSTGLCHLDIKAANILVDEKSAVICDFGFSTYKSESIKR